MYISGHFQLTIGTSLLRRKCARSTVKRMILTRSAIFLEWKKRRFSSRKAMKETKVFSGSKQFILGNILGNSQATCLYTCTFFSIINIDWRYQVWKSGVTFTDNSFLYSLWYFVFSILGNFNNFFFAAHLLDVAVGFKTLRTILQSVTHNGKQLVLTVMLLTIIVYIYTVIAFNFFRKFYVQEEDEQIDRKCHDMLTVSFFHAFQHFLRQCNLLKSLENSSCIQQHICR